VSRWIDVTRSIDDDLLCWPGRAPPVRRVEKSMSRGDHCDSSIWEMSAHTGTHLEAPLHFVEGGEPLDRVDVDGLIGACTVVKADTVLGRDEVERYRGETRLLIGSDFAPDGRGQGYPHHGAVMTPDAASILLEAGLRLLGTDRLSVDDSEGTDYILHHQLLGAGCVILEGLTLERVPPGRYLLCVLPLRLKGAEASPARALLRPWATWDPWAGSETSGDRGSPSRPGP
jgi:arylformamidase